MIGGKKTKAGTHRVIPISKYIIDILKLKLDTDSEYIITHRNKPYIYSTFRRRLKDLFPNNNTHDGRHTFANFADNSGMNKGTLQKILGLAGSDITNKTYIHKSPEELKKAMIKFDNYMDTLLK